VAQVAHARSASDPVANSAFRQQAVVAGAEATSRMQTVVPGAASEAVEAVRSGGKDAEVARVDKDATAAASAVAAPSSEDAGNGDSKITADQMVEFVAAAKSVLSTVGSLSRDVRKLFQTVEKRGKDSETLAVEVAELKKSSFKTAMRGAEDGNVYDEKYCDYDEMNALIGASTIGDVRLSTASEAAAARGRQLTKEQEGTLKMLRVRSRVKIRSYSSVGTANITRDVVNDAEADWKVIVEETKDELSVDEYAANNFLLSEIAAPSSPSGFKKGKRTKKTRRAYQPITQCISHAFFEIKKRAVAAWCKAVGEDADNMPPRKATEWLENCHVEDGGEQVVKLQFEASELGLKGIAAAAKAMFELLAVKDRIVPPANVGDREHLYLTWGHVALSACFVRSMLEQVEAGGDGRRPGMGGWYDRWRWEMLALKVFVPLSKSMWHGMIINDAEDADLFVFPHKPVPITGSRTLADMARAAAEAEEAANALAAEAEAAAVAALNGAPAGAPAPALNAGAA